MRILVIFYGYLASKINDTERMISSKVVNPKVKSALLFVEKDGKSDTMPLPTKSARETCCRHPVPQEPALFSAVQI